MGALIAVVGNTGAGKTTFAHQLAKHEGFTCGLEDLMERPFQALFARDLQRYALANQVDFLLYRAEQERILRQAPETGVLDGGMDLDFWVFTRLFHEKGYLSAEEFDLCRRLYTQLRLSLPAPEMIIWLQAPLEVLAARYARRGRPYEIARLQDLKDIDRLLQDWLGAGTEAAVVRVDAGRDDPAFCEEIEALLPRLHAL
ncbi:MAG: deoxynucleoside kinase [Chloroflexi bacterium]|jgi:deoxyadenosine/deoxycytidine kinase|nr:deoxynucleoside kinase [Chloroflexota bacterium]